MLWFIYLLTLVIFSLAFIALKIIPTCLLIMSMALNAIEAIANHQLRDSEKQERIQALALMSLIQFLVLLFKIALLALSVSIPVFLFDYFAIVDVRKSLDFFSRIDVLLATTFLIFLSYYLFKAFLGKNKQLESIVRDSHEASYSDLERVIHNLAFGSASLQKTLYGIETKILSKRWRNLDSQCPVFICALPRAGTTVLLEALNSFSGLSSHLYRDMPFIFSPVIWQVLSSPFQKAQQKKERAHGDGLLVNEDSPEAFEEVIWLKFFPQKYSRDTLYLWKKSDSSFRDFFSDYMKRIIYLRSSDSKTSARYLSKNNANIARIPAIQEMFPKASIVVPVRAPFEHAASLHRQHLDFMEKHQGERFTKKYMADIGHFEFGALHKRINFPDMDGLLTGLQPENSDYWLAYWLVSYQYLLTCKGIVLVDYHDLCQNSYDCLVRLCEKINVVVSSEQLEAAASMFKPTRPNQYQDDFSPVLSEAASKLYRDIQAMTVC